jgi:hypothetical protein
LRGLPQKGASATAVPTRGKAFPLKAEIPEMRKSGIQIANSVYRCSSHSRTWNARSGSGKSSSSSWRRSAPSVFFGLLATKRCCNCCNRAEKDQWVVLGWQETAPLPECCSLIVDGIDHQRAATDKTGRGHAALQGVL